MMGLLSPINTDGSGSGKEDKKKFTSELNLFIDGLSNLYDKG
jgi:hypothetical protein